MISPPTWDHQFHIYVLLLSYPLSPFLTLRLSKLWHYNTYICTMSHFPRSLPILIVLFPSLCFLLWELLLTRFPHDSYYLPFHHTSQNPTVDAPPDIHDALTLHYVFLFWIDLPRGIRRYSRASIRFIIYQKIFFAAYDRHQFFDNRICNKSISATLPVTIRLPLLRDLSIFFNILYFSQFQRRTFLICSLDKSEPNTSCPAKPHYYLSLFSSTSSTSFFLILTTVTSICDFLLTHISSPFSKSPYESVFLPP